MAFLTHMHERWADRVARGEDLVFTTGILRTPDAGTFNKIPGYVAFSLDTRSLSNETLSSFYDEYRREAQRFGEPTALSSASTRSAASLPRRARAN